MLSLSLTAREYDWQRPELLDEAVIDVSGARHPLVELCTTPFVANDYVRVEYV